jgi:hypothetical protein
MLVLSNCRAAATPVATAPPPVREWRASPCPPGSWRPSLAISEFRADTALANTIEGHVMGRPAPLASSMVPLRAYVTLKDLHRSAMSDSTGWFQFRNVPAGQHVLVSNEFMQYEYFTERVDTLDVSARFGWHVRLVMPMRCQWPM